jgi:rSAM/selenodomain-associated transferase 2
MPVISIIVPVYKETNTIANLVSNIKNLKDINIAECIVIDGEKDGNTINQIKDSFFITKLSNIKGRAAQMNLGASIAKGNILLFLHADTKLPHNSLSLITETLTDKTISAGAFDLAFSSTKLKYKLLAKLASLRSRLTRIPFGDQAIFINKATFEKVNGFADIPLLEDIELMKKLRSNNQLIKIINTPVHTSIRRWEEKGFFKASAINILCQVMYKLGISPKNIAKLYYGK